ncbi:hypothetical protein TM49_22265 [Martelella endophytica]|uniref:Fis family transcriptional regulator n=1 Tax=Martelella endophytica TaxID=1486262 RepID=A0A0D5LWR4_MAREN|nr:hypothetical protein TM49_22265 [Martelella endophytica]
MATALSAQGPAFSPVAASWWRSLVQHKLDPAGATDTEDRRLGASELSERRERADPMLSIAGSRLDRLFRCVAQSACGVFLSDADGFVLDHRYRDADRESFQLWGLRKGRSWAEAVEGTNGIGTCLAEGRPLVIHRDEHFFNRNIAMSCIDAPIYGPDGDLIGALDVSSARSDQTASANHMIAALVQQTARQIEADCFRAAHPGHRILIADGGDRDDTVTSLIAVDGDDLVVAATRSARQALGLALSGAFTPVPAADLLGGGPEARGFDPAERAVLVQALARQSGNVQGAARELGVSRATLYRRMKRLGMTTN